MLGGWKRIVVEVSSIGGRSGHSKVVSIRVQFVGEEGGGIVGERRSMLSRRDWGRGPRGECGGGEGRWRRRR